MRGSWQYWALPTALALVTTGAAAFGGWATITVADLPDYVETGRPLTLRYTVRQHGQTLLDGLRGRVEARGGSRAIDLRAVASGSPGEYAVTLTFPEPGDWSVTIRSGFHASDMTLPPLRVVAAGAAAPRALTVSERGRRLFVAKGCVTCHLHRAVVGSGVVPVGPELTAPRLAPEYLVRFLADPSIQGSGPDAGGRMPDLGLSAVETAALAAFLTAASEARR